MTKKKVVTASKNLICPMPGLVVSISVDVGQVVKAGQPLAVVEAMKMENVLNAECDGTIKKINVKSGDSLALNDVISGIRIIFKRPSVKRFTDLDV